MNLKEYKVQVALGLISYGDKCKIAVNTNVIKLLEYLSRNKDVAIKYAVAKNINTPVKILGYLSKDKNNIIRYWVAENKNTPVEILRILSKDKDYYTKNKAKERLGEII